MSPEQADRQTTDVAGGSLWLPPVDIVETEGGFVISLEICGVPREAIDVKLEDDRLAVSGMRATVAEGEALQYRERPRGRFTRSFSFRTPVDQEGIHAKLADGVLTLSIPKKLPKKVELET